jgi:hypothetical protein
MRKRRDHEAGIKANVLPYEVNIGISDKATFPPASKNTPLAD